jgi:hypothetical protein
MSAFFVGVDHVNALLTYCESCISHGTPVPLRGRVDRPTDSDFTEIGKELIRENIKSLAARYPSDYAELLPDDFDVADFRFEPDYAFITHAPNVIARVIKLVHCYEYQACEHDAWEESWSRKFCQWLIHKLVSQVPGYEQAPWGYSKPDDSPQVISLSRLMR